MFKILLPLALCAVPLSAQTTQFSAVLDQPNNVVSWSVSTSIGNVNLSPTTFRIGGTMEILLDSANAPFTTGALNGALSFTSPSTLSGEIPNPIPFLPPIATFDIQNMEFYLQSPSFTIQPNGDFTATLTLTTTAGTNTMGGLFGSGTEPIYGVISPPTVVTGNVSQNGNTITFHLNLNITVTIVDPGTGVSSDITFNGPLDAFADSTQSGSLHLQGGLPLALGGNVLNFSGATPNTTVFLAGSLAGRGSVFIPPVGVTLGIANPVQAGSATADASGNGSFSIAIPGNLALKSVWLQCVEVGRASNVFGSWVQ